MHIFSPEMLPSNLLFVDKSLCVMTFTVKFPCTKLNIQVKWVSIAFSTLLVFLSQKLLRYIANVPTLVLAHAL
jgi:hypothetical protein